MENCEMLGQQMDGCKPALRWQLKCMSVSLHIFMWRIGMRKSATLHMDWATIVDRFKTNVSSAVDTVYQSGWVKHGPCLLIGVAILTGKFVPVMLRDGARSGASAGVIPTVSKQFMFWLLAASVKLCQSMNKLIHWLQIFDIFPPSQLHCVHHSLHHQTSGIPSSTYWHY